MNKKQRELLDKCKQIRHFEQVAPLDDIFILPTRRNHDSGYKIMYVVGYNREENKHYLLDVYCDVINLGYFTQQLRDVNIDIPEDGIIHFWSNKSKFINQHRVSSCTFDAVDKNDLGGTNE